MQVLIERVRHVAQENGYSQLICFGRHYLESKYPDEQINALARLPHHALPEMRQNLGQNPWRMAQSRKAGVRERLHARLLAPVSIQLTSQHFCCLPRLSVPPSWRDKRRSGAMAVR